VFLTALFAAAAPPVRYTALYGVEPIACRDPVPLGSPREPPMFVGAVVIVAVCSTGLIFALKDRKPRS